MSGRRAAALLRGCGRAAAALFLLALAIRVAAIALTTDYQPLFDAADFSRHAASIADGDGFPVTQLAAGEGPTAFRPPAFPYFLGAVYALSGDSVTAARLSEAVLGAFAVLLVYLIAERLWDRRRAIAAGLAAALFPPLALWQTSLLSEPLFLAIEVGLVLVLLVMRSSPRPLRWVLLAGMLCGVAALTRSNGVLLTVPAVIAAWGVLGSTRRYAGPLIVVACAALVVAPWTARNAAEFGRFIPISTQAGYGLAGVYNETAREDPRFPGAWLAPQFEGPHREIFRDRSLDEAELDAKLRELGADHAAANPDYVVEAAGLNALRMIEVVESRGEASLATGGSTIGAGVLDLARWVTWAFLLLAVAGAAVLTRKTAPRWGPFFVWLTPVIVVLPAIPISGGARYRTPADPFVAMLAAVAAVYVIDRVREGKGDRVRAAAG